MNLGAGDDIFQWDPGDGSDIVEGGAGIDTMLFNGSNGPKSWRRPRTAGRLRFTRNLGTILMDVNDVETRRHQCARQHRHDHRPELDRRRMSASQHRPRRNDRRHVGDGVIDTVTTNGTTNVDIVDVFGTGTSVSVLGLTARVNVGTWTPTDAIVVNAQGGNDTITATTLRGRIAALTLDGGAGNDTILGSQGNDVAARGEGSTSCSATTATTARFSRRRRRVPVEPGRRQRHGRRSGRLRHVAVLRRQHRRERRYLRERRARAVLPRRRERHDGHRTASSSSTSTRSAAPTTS